MELEPGEYEFACITCRGTGTVDRGDGTTLDCPDCDGTGIDTVDEDGAAEYVSLGFSPLRGPV